MSWYGRNGYLNSAERLSNATIIYNTLSDKGWTLNAICAVLGNMDKESTINPNIWESLEVNVNRGYGLVQWTPASKLISWCEENGKDYTDGYAQLDRIEYERQNGIQWGNSPYADEYGYPTVPPISFTEFSVSTDSVDVLTNYFVLYYERPAQTYYEGTLADRQEVARYYYEYFQGSGDVYKIVIQPKTIIAEEGSTVQFYATVTVPDGVSTDVRWEVYQGSGVESLGNGEFLINSLLTRVTIRCILIADTTVYAQATILPDFLGKRKKMPIWMYLKKL